MSWLKALTSEADKQNSDALIGVTDAMPAPSLFDGKLSDVPTGAPGGLIELRSAFQTTVNKATGFMMSMEDQIAIEDAATENRELAATYTPDPNTTGAAINTLHQLFRVIPRTAAGAVFGGPIGAGVMAGAPDGVNTAENMKAEGIAPETANTVGAVQGITMGIGAMLPGSNMVKGVLPDFGAVIGANVSLGVANRAATHEILDGAGYGVQAEQYKAFDAESMIIDGTLGAAFKGVDMAVGNRPTTAQVDAALTTKSERARTESGPGIPATSKSADLHVKESDKALESVLAGQPVRVSENIVDAEFVRHSGTVPANVIDLPEPVLEGATMGARDSVVTMITGLEKGKTPDAKNPNSSATGNGQFIESTWVSSLQKHRPDLIPAALAAKLDGKTWKQIKSNKALMAELQPVLDLRKNADLSREMTGNLVDDNAAQLRGYGIKNPGAMDLYLAHHFGASRVPKMRSNPGELMDNVINASEMKANPTYRGKTVAQIVAKFERRAGLTPKDAPNFGAPEWPRTIPDDDALFAAIPKSDKGPETHLIETPERQSLRSTLADEHFLGIEPPTLEAGQRPVAFLMGGGGASGKGTLLKKLINEGTIPKQGAVHIDPDAIKGNIPEYGQMVSRGDSRAAAVVHEESSGIAKAVLARAIEGKYDVVLDRTLGDPVKGRAEIQALKDKGYEVRLFGITLDPKQAVTRALDRAEGSGRYVPTKDLLKAHKGFATGFEEYAGMMDLTRLYDNSGAGPLMIAERLDDGLTILDQEAYNAFGGRRNIDENASTYQQLEPQSGKSVPNTARQSADPARMGPSESGTRSGRNGDGQQSQNAEISQALTEAEQAIADIPNLTVLDGFDADGNPVSRSAADVLADARAEHLRDTQEAEFAPAAIACFRMKGE